MPVAAGRAARGWRRPREIGDTREPVEQTRRDRSLRGGRETARCDKSRRGRQSTSDRLAPLRSSHVDHNTMAQWTDPSRTFLIQEIRRRRIIWDKEAGCNDSNLKSTKLQAFGDVAETVNLAFPGPVKYTSDDVRSQWKNLKDTFVRKLRYINEGKYAYDTSKEITWKFYKMLSFLDDSKKKIVENPDATHPIYDIAALQREHGLDLVKSEVLQFENSNHSASSSEELIHSLFANQNFAQKEKSPIPPDTPPSPAALPLVAQSSPESYPQSSSKNHVSSSGDDEDQPRRKKSCRNIVISAAGGQDEFEIFGQLIAAQLRRTAEEHSRGESLRLQKKLNDVLFESQIALLEHQ